MKRIIICLMLLVSLILITSCSTSKLKRPDDTNLEFWITDRVNEDTFKKYTERYGIMGGREYYGSNYEPIITEDNEQLDPEYYVIYTVTAYPDYSSNKNHITRISFNDPLVYVYGLTIDSSYEDIYNKMTELGFKADTERKGVFTKGKFRFMFNDKEIYIDVDVTNHFGIVF